MNPEIAHRGRFDLGVLTAKAFNLQPKIMRFITAQIQPNKEIRDVAAKTIGRL